MDGVWVFGGADVNEGVYVIVGKLVEDGVNVADGVKVGVNVLQLDGFFLLEERWMCQNHSTFFYMSGCSQYKHQWMLRLQRPSLVQLHHHTRRTHQYTPSSELAKGTHGYSDLFLYNWNTEFHHRREYVRHRK